jgi:hypothetical protein
MAYIQNNNPFKKSPLKQTDPNKYKQTVKKLEGLGLKGGQAKEIKQGKSVWDKVKDAGKWYLDADGDGTVSKGEIGLEIATTFLPIGKLGKALSLGNKIKKSTKTKNLLSKSDDLSTRPLNKKGRPIMGQDAELAHVQSHGSPYYSTGFPHYWNEVGEQGFKRSDVAANRLVYAADDINTSKSLGFNYIGDISERSVMQVTTDGGKKISFLRSTGYGGKSLNWVDEATGKKYKVESTGINYPVMDKVHHIDQKTGKMGGGHWYKHDRGKHLGNWYDGYGIKNFDELGKGTFVPTKDAAGNLVFNEKGVLQGQWTGGKIGEEFIKQTTTIIEP